MEPSKCMRTGIQTLLFLFLCHFSLQIFANNIRVEGKTRIVGFIGTDTALIEVNVLWDNSWRDDFNWDAAWIFFKYKMRGKTGGWKHVYLSREGHEVFPLGTNEGGDYTFMFGECDNKVTGLFLLRKEISEGNVAVRLRIKWPFSANGLTRSDFGEDGHNLYVAIHAMEMVYIPNRAYFFGDGTSFHTLGDKEGKPLVISSEKELTLAAASEGPLTLPSSYPKGYRGFYVMKYEVSQEQYVEFLNSLSLEQQKTRVSNNDFEHMEKGDYVFGDLKRPDCRNGIAFLSQQVKEGPAVFGNNLNPENDFFAEEDGQTLACNYLSPSDMLAYCDWSGLRPMSELEYEKACRAPYPQLPVAGEYVWNTDKGVNALSAESDLLVPGGYNEQAKDYRKNVNSGGTFPGPVRCGIFATSSTNQIQAGATYWGVMEMGGNVGEMCYNVAEGKEFVADHPSFSHGNGEIQEECDIPAVYWPVAATAFGVRGGSFMSPDSQLRVSDRTCAERYFTSFSQRDSSIGFRGVRWVSTKDMDAGEIELQAEGEVKLKVCAEEAFVLKSVREAEPPVSGLKVSYMWLKDEKVIEGETGSSLSVAGIINNTNSSQSYVFCRQAVSAVGEAKTKITVVVLPKPDFSLSTTSAGITYCDLIQSVTATSRITDVPLHYEWSWNDAVLSVTEGNSSTYTPVRSVFNGQNGEYTLKCSVTVPGCNLTMDRNVTVRITGNSRTYTDTRDGQVYPLVKIASQCWFARNLNHGVRVEGNNYNTHQIAGIQKICYNNLESNCTNYGALYRWEEAVYGERTTGYKYVSGNSGAIQGVCPNGWHVASLKEWETLNANFNFSWNIQLSGWRKASSAPFGWEGLGQKGRWWSADFWCWSMGYEHAYNIITTSSTQVPYVILYGDSSGANQVTAAHAIRCVLN